MYHKKVTIQIHMCMHVIIPPPPGGRRSRTGLRRDGEDRGRQVWRGGGKGERQGGGGMRGKTEGEGELGERKRDGRIQGEMDGARDIQW